MDEEEIAASDMLLLLLLVITVSKLCNSHVYFYFAVTDSVGNGREMVATVTAGDVNCCRIN